MTISNEVKHTFSWSEVKDKKFSAKCSKDPDGCINSLTGLLVKEIFDKSWRATHGIYNEQHRNRLLCKVIREFTPMKISLPLIQSFFEALSKPEYNLLPLKLETPLYTPPCFGNLAGYSASDLNVQLGYECKYALEKGNDELANEIIKRCPSVAAHFVSLAAVNNCPMSLRSILEKNSYKQTVLDTSLCSISEYDYLECVKILLEFGANPMGKTDGYRLPFHEAIAKGNIQVLKTMVNHSKYKLNFDVTDNHSKNALFHAYHAGSTSILSYLLERGASVYVKDFFGNTFLHNLCTIWANADINVDVIGLLTSKDVDFNVLNTEQITPLHLAMLNVMQDMGPTISLLIQHGADITLSGDGVRCPVAYCIDKKMLRYIIPFFRPFPKIVEMLNVKFESYEEFLYCLKTNLSEALATEDEKANPLDIALLLQDEELTLLICRSLPPEKIIPLYEDLKKRFPGSHLPSIQ